LLIDTSFSAFEIADKPSLVITEPATTIAGRAIFSPGCLTPKTQTAAVNAPAETSKVFRNPVPALRTIQCLERAVSDNAAA
jgi:hypothetical protein